jgi:hypothetical protein
MVGSEDRIHGTNLRAREGAIFVYQELPKWLFVAQLETLEVDDWGSKQQYSHCRMSVCPARRKPSPQAEHGLSCISRRCDGARHMRAGRCASARRL